MLKGYAHKSVLTSMHTILFKDPTKRVEGLAPKTFFPQKKLSW